MRWLTVVREKKGCQGIFLGLVTGGENKGSGLYKDIKNGKCEIIEYIENSNISELEKFEEDIAKAFIQADELF